MYQKDSRGAIGTASDQLRERSSRAAPKGLVATGGLLGAIAASSCCIAPLVLFSLGATGAWIGNLTALAPYQPVFIVVALGFVAAGFWMVYRRPKIACPEGEVCARPASDRFVKVALWSATVLVATALAFPYVARPLLGT